MLSLPGSRNSILASPQRSTAPAIERSFASTATRTGRSIWTFAAGALSAVAVLLVGMVSTPLLLRWLGGERFGAARAVMDVFGNVGLLELGLNGSVMAALARPVGRDDDAATRSAIMAALRVYLRTTCVMLLVAAILVIFLPTLVVVEHMAASELRWAGVLAACAVILTPSSVFKALAETMQRGYMVHGWVTIQLLFTTALLLLAAWLNLGLPGQTGATVLALLPTAAALIFFGMRTYPGFWRARPDPAVEKEIRRLNWRMFCYQLTGRLSLHCDSIIVASLLGSAWVAPAYLSQRLASMAQGQLGGIGNSSWAALVDLHTKGETAQFEARLMQLTRMVSGLGAAVLGPLAAYNQSFVQLWVGNNYGGDLLTILASFNIWFWAILSLWGWTITGVGKVNRLLLSAVLFAATNVAVSIAATLAFGLAGPSIGTTAGNLLVQSWMFPKVMQEVFGIQGSALWTSALRQLVWGLPYAIAVWLLAHAYAPAGWLSLMLSAGISAGGGIALWCLFGMTTSDREFWLRRMPFFRRL